MIDLRSDTVTRPTEAMRQAMVRADVGDDVYGEDPTVRALEEHVAEMFGHDAALFTPTGSMANVLGIGAMVRPGEEVLCEASAHIAVAELGAHGALSGITMRTWSSRGGHIDLEAIAEMAALGRGTSLVHTAAISVENTHNFGGGTVLPLTSLRALHDFATGIGVPVHLDGARIWNAHVAAGVSLRTYGAVSELLTVSLSKGLGAPVGSLLVGPADLLAAARVGRKRLGGGWRQAGFLAAAGRYALDNHVERLVDDHEHARILAEACGIDPAGVDTNIVVIRTDDVRSFVDAARNAGVLLGSVGARAVRLVTHLDVTRADAEAAAAVLGRLCRAAEPGTRTRADSS